MFQKKANHLRRGTALILTLSLMFSLSGCGQSSSQKNTGNQVTITNVSYDPTRELYQAYNEAFTSYYKEKTGKDVEVVMSHGGSGGQARSVVEGADADVVTLALAHDITLVENGQGDVLLAWENEALQSVKEHPDEYEIISPSISILAQPSVAIVDQNAEKDQVADVAKDYLEYLYTEDAQKIIGEYGYRPSDENILNSFSDKFDLDMKLCSIDDFGGWDKAYDTFFNDGAIFDEIYNQ